MGRLGGDQRRQLRRRPGGHHLERVMGLVVIEVFPPPDEVHEERRQRRVAARHPAREELARHHDREDKQEDEVVLHAADEVDEESDRHEVAQDLAVRDREDPGLVDPAAPVQPSRRHREHEVIREQARHHRRGRPPREPDAEDVPPDEEERQGQAPRPPSDVGEPREAVQELPLGQGQFRAGCRITIGHIGHLKRYVAPISPRRPPITSRSAFPRSRPEVRPPVRPPPGPPMPGSPQGPPAQALLPPALSAPPSARCCRIRRRHCRHGGRRRRRRNRRRRFPGFLFGRLRLDQPDVAPHPQREDHQRQAHQEKRRAEEEKLHRLGRRLRVRLLGPLALVARHLVIVVRVRRRALVLVAALQDHPRLAVLPLHVQGVGVDEPGPMGLVVDDAFFDLVPDVPQISRSLCRPS